MRPLDPATDLSRALARGGEDRELRDADDQALRTYIISPDRPNTRRTRTS